MPIFLRIVFAVSTGYVMSIGLERGFDIPLGWWCFVITHLIAFTIPFGSGINAFIFFIGLIYIF